MRPARPEQEGLTGQAANTDSIRPIVVSALGPRFSSGNPATARYPLAQIHTRRFRRDVHKQSSACETPGAQALVFCKTQHGSNRVGQYLERAGINAAVIHGNKC